MLNWMMSGPGFALALVIAQRSDPTAPLSAVVVTVKVLARTPALQNIASAMATGVSLGVDLNHSDKGEVFIGDRVAQCEPQNLWSTIIIRLMVARGWLTGS